MGKNDDIRATLLEVIERNRPRDRSTNMQSNEILRQAAAELGIRLDHAMEEALLTQFREPEDRPFLLRLFGASESTRFVFDRGQAG
jgi:hypothetical protein